jgi:hypothetical protein
MFRYITCALTIISGHDIHHPQGVRNNSFVYWNGQFVNMALGGDAGVMGNGPNMMVLGIFQSQVREAKGQPNVAIELSYVQHEG